MLFAPMASASEQVQRAEAHKEEGNRFYREGEYRKALGAYHKVFCFVNGLVGPSGEQCAEEVKTLKKLTCLNMGACYLKLGEYQKCVEACTKSLESGHSSKAFFRRGQAYMELRNIGGARGDLQRAQDLAPDDSTIAVELEKLQSCVEHGNTAEREMYAKMFNDDGAARSGPSSPGNDVCELDAELESTVPVESISGHNNTEERCKRTIDVDAKDEAGRPDETVRPLVYSWQQTDAEMKIYVPFDQSEELGAGVKPSDVKVEFGEWNLLLVIRASAGKTPLGLRLGDFHQRIDPNLSKWAIRSSRITLTLRKREESHWFNLIQRQG